MSRYGLFLGSLQRAGRLDRTADTAGLVTPEAVAAFSAELKCRVSSVTLAPTVSKVRRTAELIAPGRDFAWLKEIERDLALVAGAARQVSARCNERTPRRGRPHAGLRGGHKQRRLAPEPGPAGRNGLMIAILALCPVRRRNFAALELGDSFVRQDKVWQIVLKRTKSGRPDERPLPAYLDAILPTTDRPCCDRVKVLLTERGEAVTLRASYA